MEGDAAVSPLAAVEVLSDIERNVPVDEWVSGLVPVWPLVRTRIGHAFSAQAGGWEPPADSVGPGTSVRRGVGALSGLASTFRTNSGRSRGGRSSVADIVFMSTGRLFADEAGQSVERICDPLRSGLEERKRVSTLLVPGLHPPEVIRPPSWSIQPHLDFIAARTRLRRPLPVKLPGYDLAFAKVSEGGCPGALPTPKVIAYAGAVVDAMARWFQSVLLSSGAGLGVVVEYYALRSMAFLLACRRLGLCSVDLQHGMQGPTHFAYAGLDAVPAGGWGLLPDWFWVWRDVDVSGIEAWAGGTHHRVFLGGNQHLERWRRSPSGIVVEFDRRVCATLTNAGTDRSVLLTLNGEEGQDQVADLLAMVDNSPSDWFWWVRGHPTHHLDDAWLDAAATRHRLDVRCATGWPLYALLRSVDAHVTRFSSVVIDASAFGVPSVILDPHGRSFFADQIESGLAWVLESDNADASELLLRVMSLIRPEATTPIVPLDAGLDFLEDLMTRARP